MEIIRRKVKIRDNGKWKSKFSYSPQWLNITTCYFFFLTFHMVSALFTRPLGRNDELALTQFSSQCVMMVKLI